MCFFRGFTWTGHFIEAFSVGGGGTVAIPGKNVFFQGFYLLASPGKNVFFQGFYLDWPLYRGILCWGRGYKVASPT